MRKYDGIKKFFVLIKDAGYIYFKNTFAWLMVCLLVYMPMYICEYFRPEQFNSLESIVEVVYSMKLLPIVIYFLPSVLFSPLAIAAITSVVEQSLRSKTLDVSSILDNSLMKWKSLVWAATLYYSSIVFTKFFIILPIYFSVSFYFYATIISLSKFKGTKAMTVSSLSLTGRWFKAAGLIFLCFFLSFFIDSAIACLIPARLGNLFLVQIVFNTLCQFLNIFFDVVLILWFLNSSVIKIDEEEVRI